MIVNDKNYNYYVVQIIPWRESLKVIVLFLDQYIYVYM